MERMTVAEFSRLCSLIDLGFGKRTHGGTQLHGGGKKIPVTAHCGFVRFNVYEIRRKGNQDLVVVVDIGGGEVGSIDVAKMEHEVYKAQIQPVEEETHREA